MAQVRFQALKIAPSDLQREIWRKPSNCTPNWGGGCFPHSLRPYPGLGCPGPVGKEPLPPSVACHLRRPIPPPSPPLRSPRTSRSVPGSGSERLAPREWWEEESFLHRKRRGGEGGRILVNYLSLAERQIKSSENISQKRLSKRFWVRKQKKSLGGTGLRSGLVVLFWFSIMYSPFLFYC